MRDFALAAKSSFSEVMLSEAKNLSRAARAIGILRRHAPRNNEARAAPFSIF
jgi:hypothetical protein